MDPLSVFGLACGIVQVVDFSSKVLSNSKELWEKGRPRRSDELEDLAHQLQGLQIHLKPSQTPLGAGHVPRQLEDEVEDLAKRCKETSDQLLQELEKLKPTRKRDVAGKLVLTIRRQKALEDLQTKLESYRATLDTKILLGLR